MFIILRRLRVSAELVIYPGEGHVNSKPKHVLDAHRRINGWFKTYLKEF
jgi:dipeptidyl aminopeptidase/acylaminoacyl peptidase